MSPAPTIAVVAAPAAVAPSLTVLAIIGDAPTRSLFAKVIVRDHLFVTGNLAEGLELAAAQPPDVAFIEIGMGDGAGLAMVHHLKAVVPGVTIFVLTSRTALDVAADAIALGGAGLLMMPIGGDEILSAVATVETRIAEKQMRAELELAASMYAGVAGWLARMAELADSPSRPAAAHHLIEVLLEATGASAAAAYLTVGEKPTELVRESVSPTLEHGPAFGMEADIFAYARSERLLVVPLATRTLLVGHVLLAEPQPRRAGAGRTEALVKLLATQATTALALLGERDRAGGAPMKDPSSSAYSFAYYADVAGREIDKARRYGRRFAIATVVFEGADDAPTLSAPEVADQLLKAARDTDVLARVDEHEFHLLMPETDGLGAHAARRRILARIAEKRGRLVPRGLLVGIATFPHDGQDLSQILRVARRRAEATKGSIVHRVGGEQTSLSDLLDTLEWEVGTSSGADVSAPRVLELRVSDAAALAGVIVADALRGGATLLAVAHHAGLCLGAAVRSAVGQPRENVTVHALDVRSSQGDEIEALSVIAEHGAYALLGRNHDGVVKGLHSADPLLADLLAERLGRAAGLRIFT